MHDEQRRSSRLATLPLRTPIHVGRPLKVSIGYLVATAASVGLVFVYSAVLGSFENPLSGSGDVGNRAPSLAVLTAVTAFVAGAGRPAARGLAAVGALLCGLMFGAVIVGAFRAGAIGIAFSFLILVLAQLAGIVLLALDDGFFAAAARARRGLAE